MKAEIHLVYDREWKHRCFAAAVKTEDGRKFIFTGAVNADSTVEAECACVNRILNVGVLQNWDIELHCSGNTRKWADGEWNAEKPMTKNFKERCENFRERHTLVFKDGVNKELKAYLMKELDSRRERYNDAEEDETTSVA